MVFAFLNIWFSVFDKHNSGFSDLVFEETSVSDDRQEVFAESSDEDVGITACTDDNNSQGQEHQQIFRGTEGPGGRGYSRKFWIGVGRQGS